MGLVYALWNLPWLSGCVGACRIRRVVSGLWRLRTMVLSIVRSRCVRIGRRRLSSIVLGLLLGCCVL